MDYKGTQRIASHDLDQHLWEPTGVTYLNCERLQALDSTAFHAEEPYPWLDTQGLLTNGGFGRLRATLPRPSLFTSLFGTARSYGQRSHDRLGLQYDKGLPLAEPWHAFVKELHGPTYRRFLQRMFGRRRLWLGFRWDYTPNGCSVSPHCDAQRKLGSHIFYFNTEEDWDPAWGGQTLILDDGGRLRRESAPDFEDFDRIIPTGPMGNRSLLFARREKSWHGVREIRCPPGDHRKVFIVVIGDWFKTMRRVLASRLRGEPMFRY